MRIALATCRTLPPHERDDLRFHAVLRELGVDFELTVWDDPTVDWASFDAVLIRSTWDYWDKHGQFVDWAERTAACTRLFNPAPLVRWNTHKGYLRELSELGVPLAETVWFATGDRCDLAAVVRERGIRRGFLKPLVAANARGTVRFDASDGAQLAAAQGHLERMTERVDMMLQPYLSSVETQGELSAIFFDGALSHAVRKVPAAGDYRVQDDWGAHDEPVVPDADVLAVCERTLAGMTACIERRGWDFALPLLYARIDLLRDDAGRWVLNELEVVEPSLFFRHGPEAPNMLARALLRRLS